MPESTRDRPTRCYEYVFLLTKSKKYYYDWQAVAEPIAPTTAVRLKSGVGKGNKYAATVPGQNQPQKINRPRRKGAYTDEMISPVRSRRNVWQINTASYRGGHFAAFPPKLAETCILSGCPVGGIVLDPFFRQRHDRSGGKKPFPPLCGYRDQPRILHPCKTAYWR